MAKKPLHIQQEALNTDEVALLLGTTRGNIRKLVERRRLPFHKLGRRLYFLRAELLRFLEELPGVRVDEAIRNSLEPLYGPPAEAERHGRRIFYGGTIR